ncbi:hypothetical protein PCURB6_14440 [Paenibacillus curdlanolyticus]|nr:hypothetical protein PCURB6_14440 [Paenibacillus curdlanolyticus]
MKEQAEFRLDRHQIVPFLLTEWELPIAQLTLTTSKPGCNVRLTFEIGWSKPITADLGEMEIVIRASSSSGPELFRISEMCHWHAMMTMDCDVAAQEAGAHTYWLNACSAGRRAILDGPVIMRAIVL